MAVESDERAERESMPGAAPAARTDAILERGEIKNAAAFCFKVWLCVVAGLMLVGLVGVALLQPNASVDVPGWPASDLSPGWHNAVTAYERWDALWYLRIASDGYDVADKSAAFFPGYPLLTRAFSFVTGGHPLAGGYIASNLACLLAMIVVFLMTK